MANINTYGGSFLHFAAAAGDVVTFDAPINTIILTCTGTITVDFDGAAALAVSKGVATALPLALPAGNHVLPCIAKKIIFGGSGTVSGCGLS